MTKLFSVSYEGKNSSGNGVFAVKGDKFAGQDMNGVYYEGSLIQNKETKKYNTCIKASQSADFPESVTIDLPEDYDNGVDHIVQAKDSELSVRFSLIKEFD